MVLDAPPRLADSECISRSAIDVRVVLFAIRLGELWVAVTTRSGNWELPSVTLAPTESLDAAALRALRDCLCLNHRYLEQLYSLANEAAESPAVLITYLGIAESGEEGPGVSTTIWRRALDLPELSEVDNKIVDYALVRLRAKLGYTSIAFHLLPVTFSLSELQQVYEIVLAHKLDKRNFRRRMQSAEILDATEESRREGSHRPARLFRFRAAHDADSYLTPVWATASDGESGEP